MNNSAMEIARTLMLLIASVALTHAAAPMDVAPDVLARSVTNEVVSLVRTDKELHAGNPGKVMQLVESKVLPHFDFTRMTQLAVGRNWRDATPEQQKALVGEFRTLLVRTYAMAVTLYSNETIDYRPVRMTATDVDVIVKSVIRQPTGQPISIDYSMEKVAAAWKVYDVKIEGVSLVGNYRSTFNTEVQKNGIEGLIKALSSKNHAAAVRARSD